MITHMTSSLRCILTSLTLGVSIVAHAEPASTRSASGRPLAPILTVLDTDHDGILSAVEIAAAPLALTALDLNEDGIISPDERRATDAAGQPVRVGHRATSSNVMLALDANFDGDIQSLEVANAVSSLKRLDRNADGELTPNELRPVIVARSR